MNVPEQNEVDHSLEDEKKTTPSQVILQSLQSLPSLLFLPRRRDAHFLPRRSAVFICHVLFNLEPKLVYSETHPTENLV